MKILELFNKSEHEDETVFAEQDSMFQHCHKRYYIRNIGGGTELWARSILNQDESYFIGKLVGNKVVLARAYYTYPYDVMKAGSKLIRIFLHNDWRDL